MKTWPICSLILLLILCSLNAQQSVRNYTLQPNDLVDIKVFQEDDLASIQRISQDGMITFPLIGPVRLGGRTVQEATQLLRDRLGAKFLVHPQVTLTVTEYAKRIFTVIGQVQRPGTYRFPDNSTLNLVQAIGIGGGYTRIADAGRITIKRQINGMDTILKINGKNMARDNNTQTIDVIPGDLITVGERIF
ncbi:MAG: polysaccharide biosynthesis/export family protein [Verrucomicrobiota bacterium]